MILEEIQFAGYQCFPTSFFQPELEVAQLRLAPLTLILGKNNSGKSTLIKLVRHALVALAQTQAGPLPLTSPFVSEAFAHRFRQLQHCGSAEHPIHFHLRARSGTQDLEVLAQIHRASDGDEEPIRALRRWEFQGKDFSGQSAHDGLLPEAHPDTPFWRQQATDLLRSSLHLGPVRPAVQFHYPVAAEGSIPISAPQRLEAEPKVCQRVSEWCQQHLDGWSLKVSRNLDNFELLLSRGSVKGINLAQAGQGIQQVLPLLVNCQGRQISPAEQPWLDCWEQPELHLHDAAHAGLADLLIDSLQPGRGHFLVETHSENLLLRLRRRVAEGKLDPQHLALYFVDEQAKLQRIEVDREGQVSLWPAGVFSEAFEEIKAIHRARAGG